MKKNELNNYQKGKIGEAIAKEYLIANGYEILAQNYRPDRFEIDLIAKKDVICFVEVKVIEKTGLFSLESSVNYNKQNKIKYAASFYISENRLFDVDIRFDVIGVTITDKQVYHFESAF
ncbi:MAG: YraN family protein [Spirochaetales bacterium]|nr:YraN family protein [Spirochaetales bacterium]